ncbi:hypothetical protein FQN55_002532, partial [Onygenales sp. PD_40]
LSNLLDTCCVIYLDDIVIYSNFIEKHEEHIKAVLECLSAIKCMTDLHPELNLKALKECILHINALMACVVQNALIDENVAADVTEGNLRSLMSQLFINQMFKFKTAYTHKLLELLIDLLLHVQAQNAECTEI